MRLAAIVHIYPILPYLTRYSCLLARRIMVAVTRILEPQLKTGNGLLYGFCMRLACVCHARHVRNDKFSSTAYRD
jgi:hypothetical protein